MVIWHSSKCRVIEHDYAAFKQSTLYDLLVKNSEKLLEYSFYFFGGLSLQLAIVFDNTI